MIQNPEIETLDALAKALNMSPYGLSNYLRTFGLPRRLAALRRESAAVMLPLPAPPAVYLAYWDSVRRNYFFTDQALELFRPVTHYHFDYKYLLPTRFPALSSKRLSILTGDWIDKVPFQYDWDSEYFTSDESVSFRQTLTNYYSQLPDEIRRLNNDELFSANADMSVAFLHGVVSYPTAGISSPHLKGSFLLGLRKSNTGYLALNCDCRAAEKLGASNWADLLAWFQANNDLYGDLTPVTSDNIDIRLGSLCTATVVAAEVPGHQGGLCNELGHVRLNVRQVDGTTVPRYLPLEAALAMAFPLLFPFGLPHIPAKTLRKKARLLLAAHPYYRCGRLQCHMVLFLYHVIQDYSLAFKRTKLSIQPLQVPVGTNRQIDDTPLYQDPASPAYWSARQSEVRAMCNQYGDPDLMLTLTFVNKWPEVVAVEASLKETLGSSLDLRFSPIEAMMIWKYRFLDIKDSDFQNLATLLGFPPVSHYTWRLEFQTRGAPHVHALLWLAQPLSLANLPQHMFATTPSDSFPWLRGLVTSTMIHTCTLARCQRGDPTRGCRYGFPKAPCSSVYADDDGALRLPRSAADARVVDYSPALLMKWHGHAHMHVLKTTEHPQCSANALFYVVKYNFKQEPSLRVDLHCPDNDQTLFHSRIISSEEAAARIFSFQFHGSSSTFTYLSLTAPENRRAAFVSGVQIQVPDIEKYFLRPPELDRLDILSFFSLYDISADQETNAQRSSRLQPDLLAQFRRCRPPNTLMSGWEDQNLHELTYILSGQLFPAPDLPHAHSLTCRLRRQPKIVIPPKYGLSTHTENFAYAYLLTKGCWRSDDELRADQPTWLSALAFHGLEPPDLPGAYSYSCHLFEYMLKSMRYSSYELASMLTRLPADISSFVQELYQTSTPDLRRCLSDIEAYLRFGPPPPAAVELNTPEERAIARDHIRCDFSADERAHAQEMLDMNLPRLVPDQLSVFQYVRSHLSSNTIFSLFVSGKAGTGKSFLIACLQNLFITANVPFVTAASTGIAATLIHGHTVHSTFGLFTNSANDTVCSLNIAHPRGLALSLCRVIIIDEITMISRSVLNALDNGLRRLAGQSRRGDPSLPFGGQSLLLFGDLAQVPAVVRARDDFAESAEQFFESSPYANFTRFNLTRVMRRDTGQEPFMAMLDEVRSARDTLSPSSIALLRQRFIAGTTDQVLDRIDEFVGGDDPSGMVITFTNQQASYYNDLILAKRDQPTVTLHAKFFVRHIPCYRFPDSTTAQLGLTPSNEVFETVLASEQEIRLFRGAFKRRQFNTIIPFTLTVAPGARVMLLQNLDLKLGLINGARGTVLAYHDELDALEVRFDCLPPPAQPTMVVRTQSVEYPLARGAHIFMYQFPLKLSWAVTAHKSQGQTLSKVAIDISAPAFAHGSFYVALSRVRSLDSLLLFGLESFPPNGPSFHVNTFIQQHDLHPGLNE